MNYQERFDEIIKSINSWNDMMDTINKRRVLELRFEELKTLQEEIKANGCKGYKYFQNIIEGGGFRIYCKDERCSICQKIINDIEELLK